MASRDKDPIVLNACNLGYQYESMVHNRERCFTWNGVRIAKQYYEVLSFDVICICKNATHRKFPVPSDLTHIVTVCPVDDRWPDVDDCLRFAVLWSTSAPL